MCSPILKNRKGPFYFKPRPGKRYFLFFLFLISITRLPAQCIATGFQNATVFATDNAVGTYDFSTPGNAQTSDNSRASAASILAILTADTYFLKATGFNFSIPSYASICGVVLEAECRATGVILTAAVHDNEIKLVEGGIITGNNKSGGSDWATSDAYRTYGGASDLWGTTLTPADVNASDFGVVISARIIALAAALPSAQVDHIRLNIYYNPILPVTLAYFNAEKNNNKVILEWKTTEEEEQAAIYLERSDNNGPWLVLKKYELQAVNSGSSYKYEDILSQEGDYNYRLKIASASGLVTYSAIKKINFRGKGIISLYPNPVIDYLNIENTGSGNLTIFNSNLKQMSVPTERTGLNSYRVNTVNLPSGIYFVKTGYQTLRFLKR